jgi:hypothetical protein
MVLLDESGRDEQKLALDKRTIEAITHSPSHTICRLFGHAPSADRAVASASVPLGMARTPHLDTGCDFLGFEDGRYTSSS